MKMTKERFEQTAYTCTYEEYKKCECSACKIENCPHREAFRRFPTSTGGLGLCPNLKD
ncbi:MAG: hypothetical protein ACI4JM_10465 [Oscillospiraceae bacterium]